MNSAWYSKLEVGDTVLVFLHPDDAEFNELSKYVYKGIVTNIDSEEETLVIDNRIYLISSIIVKIGDSND